MTLKDMLFDRAGWPGYIDTLEKAQSMRAQLVDLENNLNQQVIKHGDEDRQWHRKASGLLIQVRQRLTETNAAIKRFNIAGEAATRKFEHKWTDFAEELALALDEVAPEKLDEIMLGDRSENNRITAGQWLDRRIAKMERKGVA